MEITQIRWLVVGLLAIILIFFLVKSFNQKSIFGTALRSEGKDSPYSFTKVQLLWWTIIISISFSIVYATTGIIDTILNTTALGLLGISLGTVAAGKVIDNGENNNPSIQVQRHQLTRPSRNLLTDILSDHNGVNLHRFQALIFNVLFGVIFLIQVFESGMTELPEFGTTALGLIGMSSGGFLALKFNENLNEANFRALKNAPVSNKNKE